MAFDQITSTVPLRQFGVHAHGTQDSVLVELHGPLPALRDFGFQKTHTHYSLTPNQALELARQLVKSVLELQHLPTLQDRGTSPDQES